MRNLRRRLFAIVSVLSLICFLATVGLWVRSYWYYDAVDRARDRRPATHLLGVDSFKGTIYLRSKHGRPVLQDSPARWSHSVAAAPLELGIRDHISAQVAGFGYVSTQPPRPLFAVFFPHWFPAVVFAVAPAYWLHGAPVRRRRKLGLCLNCGYDLRASPERCPECGRAASA